MINYEYNEKQLTLAVFQTYPDDNLSAFDVWQFLIDNESINKETTLIMIRKAINDLSNNNEIIKKNMKVLGLNGMPIMGYTWKLKTIKGN